MTQENTVRNGRPVDTVNTLPYAPLTDDGLDELERRAAALLVHMTVRGWRDFHYGSAHDSGYRGKRLTRRQVADLAWAARAENFFRSFPEARERGYCR
jgi:hypothetical protein